MSLFNEEYEKIKVVPKSLKVEPCTNFDFALTDGDPFISTGLFKLDAAIGGWNSKKEIAILQARTGVGKSWMLLRLALNLSEKGYKVGYYDGENGHEQCYYRLLAMKYTGLSLYHLGHHTLTSDEREIVKTASLPDFYLYSACEQGILNSVNLAYFAKANELDFLFIDYFDYVDPLVKSSHSVYEDYKTLANELSQVQGKIGCPIICACQCNREGASKGKTADTTNISGSDAIGHIATTVMTLSKDSTDALNTDYTLSVVKSRYGAKADIKLVCNFMNGIIKEETI